MTRLFRNKSFTDKESEHHLQDLDGKTAVRTLSGKALKDLFDLVNSAGFLAGETYDGFLCEETLITRFKTFHFFLQGEETFQISLGFNSDLDIGALKTEPPSEIKRTFFVQGLNLGLEPIGSVMGVMFAIGGNNIAFSILQDESTLFVFADGNQLQSVVPIPAGTYELVIKAEGTGGTQYISKVTIFVLPTALISNINLSNLTIEENAPNGSTVGALSTIGGEQPIAFSIAQQQDSGGLDVDVFEITNDLLVTKEDAGATGSDYSVIVVAEDSRAALPDNERLEAAEFTINVVDSAFSNATSLSFNGIDEYIRIPSHASLNVSAEFTISAWVKITSFSGGRYLFTKWVSLGNQRAMACVINSGGFVQLTLSEDGSSSEVIDTTQAIVAGVWTHIACQFKENEGRVFINGVDKTANPVLAASTVKISTADFIIGAFSSNSPSVMIDGLVDEFAYYNKFLSQTDIASIYNGGVPSNLNLFSSSSDLISWWRMGDLMSGTTLPDQVGVNDATITNMNNSNKSTDVPI